MPESLDIARCAAHVARRWRLIAASCVVAMIIAAAFTSLQADQFTSRARVLIIPPTSDSFPATALSPTYMESLRTYEHLALSDGLLEKAIEDLDITFSHQGLLFPAFGRRLLTARILPNTRILEIQATLPDAQKAQALAAYIASGVIRLAESSAEASPSRTEVLRLVDPGVVPTVPQSAGLLFGVLAAFFAAFVLAVVYLTFEFAVQSQKAESLRKSMRVAGHG